VHEHDHDSSWEKEKVYTMVQRKKMPAIRYPYDLGLYRNICSVLGPRVLMWLLPRTPPVGNGLQFDINASKHDGESSDEQGNTLLEMDFYRAVQEASLARRMTRTLRRPGNDFEDSDHWSSDEGDFV
jgi:hypothetical protein